MADKDESTSDAVTIDTNPGNLFAHPPLRGHTTKLFLDYDIFYS
jgi:hypothetical protein